ncbi:hypothetical protein JCM10212_000723 [Sporobolomyces blumeae]
MIQHKSKPQQGDLENQHEGSALLGPSPPPYTPVASASGSGSTGPDGDVPASDPNPTQLPTRSPSRSHPSGPTAFAALPLPTTTYYSHQRAMRQADRRARKRFCIALCCASMLYILLAALIGGIIGEEMNRNWNDGHGRHGGRHRGDGGWLVGQQGQPDSPGELFASI